MSYLERAIADRYAKFTGDPNNNIQPMQGGAHRRDQECQQTLWAGGKLLPPAAL